MRILEIVDDLELIGGAQKVLVIFAEAIAGKGHELTIISLKDANRSMVTARLEQAGARLVFLPGKNLIDPARFFNLVRILRDENFDIVHTHLSFANVLGVAASGLSGKTAIATLHNEEFQKRPYIKFQAETLLLRYVARAVIAVGYRVEEAHRSRFAGKEILVVMNPVDMPPHFSDGELRTTRIEYADDPSRPIIIAVGRLIKRKGYNVLLTAFQQVSQRYPEARLLITSDGPLYHELKAQISELELDEKVKLLGVVPDIPRLMAASDLYVSSSSYEGLSIAMLEAMAAGLPVVVTNVGDASRVVGEESGCLVEPGQPTELAEGLCSMLAEPEKMRRFGANARQYVLQNHDPSMWSEKLLEIYQQMAYQTKLITG